MVKNRKKDLKMFLIFFQIEIIPFKKNFTMFIFVDLKVTSLVNLLSFSLIIDKGI